MGTGATTDTAAGGSVISLPKGGGAIGGLGEKFTPDLFTGSGVFSVPIGVPAGRLGVQPQLTLGYGTGNGNGPFGLGWQLSVPGVTRKTSHGVPGYIDASDVFVLAGSEDLVPVAGTYPGRVRYRPRTEGLFARIEHVRDGAGNFWEVRGKEGMLTRYGTPRPADAPPGWRDPAAIADPRAADRTFAWRITETRDPLDNLIRYEYLSDSGDTPEHRWDQPLLSRISYADYGSRDEPSFLVTVEFEYEARPDPCSDHRAGFEVRTSRRCHTVRVVTHAADGVARVYREYRLGYTQAAFNGVSLLTRIDVVGIDGDTVEHLPPMAFEYARFEPAGRRFEPVTGPLPGAALHDPAYALVDMRGVGLPDLVELGATHRYWRNAGHSRFETPRSIAQAPPARLGDPDVQFLDADGDGRPDLMVSSTTSTGYYPMAFGTGWSRRSFRPYRQAPSISLADPSVKLVDLDGDGLTDVLRTGTRLESWFNDADARTAWQRTLVRDGLTPPVDLADPRVRMADMTGDGLVDIVVLRSGNVTYWPNLGHGRWGPMVTMRNAPRLPDRYDPRRLLLGDVDGDGAADLVYVDDGRVLLWGNRSGNGWTPQPVTVRGTPRVVDSDAFQLTDLHGTGMGGLLFSNVAPANGGTRLRFLDFTGGVKPYLLEVMDNRLGAMTRVRYRPSTVEYLRDEARAATRWRTTLPFPVQVVSKVEVIDAISGGRLVTEYRYHHGYWDGLEREFRGFGMVEQLDAETFTGGAMNGPGGPNGPTHHAHPTHYAPPTLTKRWFHLGPVAAVESADWTELDLRHEYWSGDAPMFARPDGFLAGLTRSQRRSALRALRGQPLRTELYALDDSDRADRPYTVNETLCGVRTESTVDNGIFFPFVQASRTTEWERGDEPMTRFEVPAKYDAFGFVVRHVSIGVPRGRDPLVADPNATEPYLATYTTTEYARRDDTDRYIVDRVAQTTTYEVVNDGSPAIAELCRGAIKRDVPGVSRRVIGNTRTRYDGAEFVGLPLGQLGDHGLAVHSESLAFPSEFLDVFGADVPVYLDEDPVGTWPADYPAEFRELLPGRAGYRYADDAGSELNGFYVVTARNRFDVHEPGRAARGLPMVSLDALGAPTRMEYDVHDLLPIRSLDAAGLAVTVAVDYRVLQPRDLVDVNGNTETVTFSPLGNVTARYVRGKAGEGDLNAPSQLLEYDLLAYLERGQPISVRSVRRVHHDSVTDVPQPERDEVIVSVEYSDGFGRAVQTRTQAEDVLFGDPVFGDGLLPIDQSEPVGDATGRARTPGTPDNVTVSGWQIYDNKGRVVRKYQPFFATDFAYAPPTAGQLGEKVEMFFDPRGRVTRTLHPDGSEERVVFGVPADLADPDSFTPTAWETYTYDANDNAGRTHIESAGEQAGSLDASRPRPAPFAAYASHWNTPTSVEVDALGRPVRTVARNGATPDTWITSLSVYDIQDNLVSITDPLGRQSFRYVYDLTKRRWRISGIDTGRRDTVPDALGNPVETRDSKGAFTLHAYDRLHRPSRFWARDVEGGPVTLRQRIEYGDAGRPDQPPADRAEASARNLLGRPVRHHDEAGLSTVGTVDFKGNVTDSVRQVIADAPILATYADAAANGWQVAPFRVDWTPPPGRTLPQLEATLLDPAGYATSTRYDALDRITRHLLPADVEGRRRVLSLFYNRAGALDSAYLDAAVYVQRIAYNADGERVLVAHGNQVLTRYAYDARSLRLVRLRSERYTLVDKLTYRPAGPALQDYGYQHDLVGNVLTIRDRTPGSGIPNNPDAMRATDPRLRHLLAAGDALDRRFEYDPVYRLLSATGREHKAPPPGDPWIDLPRGTDLTEVQPYLEKYGYDDVGNLLALVHVGTGGFTRQFVAKPGNNRLHQLAIGSNVYGYEFDANGNQTVESTTRRFTWNHDDRLSSFATQVPGAEPSVHAHYLYDSAGQRVKKLVRRQGGTISVTHFIGDLFEHHRWSGSKAGINNHIHMLDGERRIALVRVGAAHPDDRGPAVAYQLADHLGSSAVVVDDTGAFISREEYTPYGETSFGRYAGKRYRFTGKERDEESGLAYHEARYLSPYTGRWLSPDPVVTGNTTPYGYAAQNPVRLVDQDGEDPKLAPEVKAFIDGIADYYNKMTEIASDSLKGSSKAPFIDRMRTGTLAGDLMREDLGGTLGKRSFEVRYSSSSLHEIDLSLKKAPVDVEFKLTQSATRSKQSVAFQKYAQEHKRLLVFVYGNAAPQIFNYTDKPLTKKQLAALTSATEKIQAKLSKLNRTSRQSSQDNDRNKTRPRPQNPGKRDLYTDGGLGGKKIDYYGHNDLMEGAEFLRDVATLNVVGVVMSIIECVMSERCRNVLYSVPTGGLPATTMTLSGGWAGKLRYPGIPRSIGAGRLQER